jgi:hypothetical protein
MAATGGTQPAGTEAHLQHSCCTAGWPHGGYRSGSQALAPGRTRPLQQWIQTSGTTGNAKQVLLQGWYRCYATGHRPLTPTTGRR